MNKILTFIFSIKYYANLIKNCKIYSIYEKRIMKNFYPAIVVPGGDVIHNHFANSHKDLLEWADVKKDHLLVTFRPSDDQYRYDDLDNYTLIINQSHIPDWFDDDVKEAVIGQLKSVIEKMIVRGRKKLILNEGVILQRNASINFAKNARIFAMYDESVVRNLIDNSHVEFMTDRSLISEMKENTSIGDMLDRSRINTMMGSARVNRMYGRSKILKMKGGSKVDMVKGHSSIQRMDEESFARSVKHMSVVDEMHGESTIDEMWDWAVVGAMFDQARVNYMDDDSKVHSMYGNSTVNSMYGSAIIEELHENSVVKQINEKAKILKKRLKDSK
jgi:hypothetical protein